MMKNDCDERIEKGMSTFEVPLYLCIFDDDLRLIIRTYALEKKISSVLGILE